MKQYSPRARRLLRQAQNTAKQNKRAAAEQLFRQLTAEEPEIAAAWVGLGEMVTEPAEQRHAFERALALDPENYGARRGLAELNGEEPPPAPEPEPEEEADEEAESGLPVFDASTKDAARDWRENETPVRRFDSVEAAVSPARAEPPQQHAPAPEAEEQVGLRCYRCGKPINSKNSRLTPVGYMCTDCIREAEDTFFTAEPIHYLIAMVVAFPLGAVLAFLASFIGGSFFGIIIMFFAAPAAGTLTARAVFRAIGRRRGRYIPYLVGAAIVVPAALIGLLNLVAGVNVFGLLIIGLYAFLATSAAYYQLR
jgi:hypothetical protein